MRLRVATWNVMSGRSPRGGAADPDELARAVAALDVDVLALQEVDSEQPRSAGVDQTELVAEAMEAEHRAYLPTVWGTPGPEADWTPADGAVRVGPAVSPRRSYGIALVSRLPVTGWSGRIAPPGRGRIPVPVPSRGRVATVWIPDEPRAALTAEVATDTGPLRVCTTHLSFLPRTNRTQLRALVRTDPDSTHDQRPFDVLLGDLNMTAGRVRRTTGWAVLARDKTFPSPAPRVQLDHVLAHPDLRVRVHEAAAVTAAVSDHRALRVDLDLTR